MRLITILFLLSFSVKAQDFKLKAATNLDHLDLGAEIQMASYNPKGFGVFGADLQDGLPMFNMGYNYHFKYSEVMPFIGVGLQKMRYQNGSHRLLGAAVSSQGCKNGKGKGVQKNCKKNGSGSSGGNTGTVNKKSLVGSYVRETVVQELGVRVVPKIDSRLRPMLELNTSTANAGFDFDHTMKIGIIFDL